MKSASQIEPINDGLREQHFRDNDAVISVVKD